MRRLLTLFVGLLIAACAASAQTQPSDSPPLIAGRLSLAEGDAQIWRVEDDTDSTDGEWDTAQINDVVTVGTGLYTGATGRIELRVGPNTFRLASGSRGGFSQLDYDNAVFNLEHGSLNARLASPEHGETTSITVNGTRIDLAAPGRYRIDAGDGSGQARASVFSGRATVQTGTSGLNVAAGQALSVGPNFSGIHFEQASATAFDQWALSRDDRYANVRSAQYVSSYMTGYEELDVHGDWIPDGTYGNVWVPRVVPVGWAPYRNGQWRWVRPWGWTWVDYSPWGYAPFHYGRWVTINNRWCWWPGGYHRRPVWAPALVGFVGGSHVSVSVGFGGGPVVGWYPLAPWHHYRPHYRHNHHYTTIVNQTIINTSPRPGLSRTNPNPEGTTMVPGPRFRDPIMKVALPVGPDVAKLQPAAPPPKNTGQIRRVAEDGMVRRPNRVQPSPQNAPSPAPATATQPPQAVAPAPRREAAPVVADPVPNRGATPQPPQVVAPAPKRETPPVIADPVPNRGATPQPPQVVAPAPKRETRVMPPVAADPVPNRGVTPQPPLPGNDPAPLAQPPKFNRGSPTAIQTTPPPPRPAPDVARPAPRARVPQELLPQAAQHGPQVAPADPARIPPGAPPTIRQPPAKVPAAQPAPQTEPPTAQRVPSPQPGPQAPAEAPRGKQSIARDGPRGNQMQR